MPSAIIWRSRRSAFCRCGESLGQPCLLKRSLMVNSSGPGGAYVGRFASKLSIISLLSVMSFGLLSFFASVFGLYLGRNLGFLEAVVIFAGVKAVLFVGVGCWSLHCPNVRNGWFIGQYVGYCQVNWTLCNLLEFIGHMIGLIGRTVWRRRTRFTRRWPIWCCMA